MRWILCVKMIFPLMVLIVCVNLGSSTITRLQSPVVEKDVETFLEKWNFLKKMIGDMIDGGVRQILPMAIRSSSEIEMSPRCQGDMLKFILGLRQLKRWAFTMFDSTGKPLSGMMRGTLATLGSYDECLAISVPDSDGDELFRGQYCAVEFRPPLPPKPWFYRMDRELDAFKNVSKDDTMFGDLRGMLQIFYTVATRYGVCVPSTCLLEDMRALVKHGTSAMGLNGDVPRCETLKKGFKLDKVQLTIVCVLVIFAILVAIASLVDMYFEQTTKKLELYTKNPGPEKKRGYPMKIAMCFSLFENTKKLVNVQDTKTEDDGLPAMHGVRVLSMFWIILGHTYLFPDWQLATHFRNWTDVIENSVTFMTITNASGCLDSFFFLGGLLLSFGVIKAVDKSGQKVFNIPMLLIRRIWRLLPTTMLVVGLLVLSPLSGSGPLWHEMVEVAANNCRTNWWPILVFGNNYVKTIDMCLASTWYISADMQLFLFGLVFLALVFKNPKLAFGFNAFIGFAGIAATGLVTYVKRFPPVNLSANPDQNQRLEFSEYTYFQTYPHLAPYAIGLTMGMILARYRDIKISRWLSCFGWMASAGFCLSVLYAPFIWNSRIPTEIEAIIYSSLYRTTFTLGIAWVSFACATSRAGYINHFLSWKAFIPLSRLTFLMYLLQVIVIQCFYGAVRNGVESDNLTFVWLFFGHLTATILLSLVCRLLFEAPLIELEKVAIGAIFGKKLEEEPIQVTNVIKKKRDDTTKM